MATFFAFYPPSGGSNASIGINGATAPTSSTEVAGINPGGNLQPLQTDNAGNLLVSINADPAQPQSVNLTEVAGAPIALGQTTMAASLPVAIASNQSAIPISAATLPLPTGAATSANQTNGSQETQIVQGGNTATVTAASALKVDGSAVTQPVSAASLPLPAGASTSANQTNGSQQTQIVYTGIPAIVSGAGALKTDSSATTQPISGTVTVMQGTAGNLNAQIIGTGTAGAPSLGVLSIQGVASGQAVPISGTVTVTSTSVTQGTSPWVDNVSQFGGTNVSTGTGTSGLGIPRVTVSNDSNILATQSGTWNLNNITGTVSLPTGAATSANQTNGSQATQIVQGGNTAVVSAAGAQKVDGSAVTQPVSGTVTVTQGTAANLNATVTGTVAATQSGTWNITNISGTVSLPTGASTSANQTSVIGSVGAGTAATNSTLTGGVFNTAAPSLSNGQQAALQLTSAGALITSATSTVITSSTSTITSVAGAASSTSLLASNANRKGAYFFNDSTATLYLAFAGSASTSTYTVQIVSNGFYEMPNPSVYTGAIFGIWSAANGNVRITELS
jgi:hypothetical protein